MSKFFGVNKFRIQPRYLGPEGDPPAGTPPPKDPKEAKPFTQQEVDAVAAKVRAEEKAKAAKERAADLERIRALEPEAEKRAELEKQIEDIHKATMTKEEIAKRAAEAKEKEAALALKKEADAAKKWKETYEKEKVIRDIAEAATKPDVKAYNPNQMVKLLKGDARVVQKVVDGKPVEGEFETKISYTDKSGTVLDLSPVDALKLMKKEDIENSGNLFENGVVSGLGGTGNKAHAGKNTRLGMAQDDFTKGYIKGTLPKD